MKKLIFIYLTLLPLISISQIIDSYSISYYGEMITHPGIKISLNSILSENVKNKIKISGNEKSITKGLILSPYLGYYYHRRYQSGIHLGSEINFIKQNNKGNAITLGLGIGYLNTLTSNTYKVLDDNSVKKILKIHHYLTTNYSVCFLKKSKSKDKLSYFIKPQITIAAPNFPRSVGYFFLEIGLNYKLKRNE